MKAPDKIYIDFIDDAICMSSLSETPNGGEEYVRKDALFEWAEKCKKIIEGSLRVKYDESLAIKGLMYAVFMDKLNSM